MPAPWPQWLRAKANLLLWRGYMYRPGPPEDFFDCMTGDVITRAELASTYGEDLVARVARLKPSPARSAFAIGLDGDECATVPRAGGHSRGKSIRASPDSARYTERG
jgi:hypothetical protein